MPTVTAIFQDARAASPTPSRLYCAYFAYDSGTPCRHHEYYVALSGIEIVEPAVDAVRCRTGATAGGYVVFEIVILT